MRIRITDKRGYTTRDMKTCEHCGHIGPVVYDVGSVADLPDALAVKLIRVGIAVAVREAPVERAIKAPPESTSKPRPPASRSKKTAKEEAE